MQNPQEQINFPEPQKRQDRSIEESEEEIENLAEEPEPGDYYRGSRVDDAFLSLFGELELDPNPKNDIIGSRDNASINLHDAIYFAPTSKTKKGQEFLCAIGFDASKENSILPSRLDNINNRRISGSIKAKEIIIRFPIKQKGEPPKEKVLSPKEFFEWYKKNISKPEETIH